MDFSLEYTKEQEEFAKEVRKWLDKNVPEDLVSMKDPQKMTDKDFRVGFEFGRRLGEKGWLFPSYPREYGGGGLDVDHCFVINEEFDARGLSRMPFYNPGGPLAVPALMVYATEEQKKRFLPPMLQGKVATWQLFTEPEAGTDEANQQTNALRHRQEKEYFIIKGQKIFVGGLPQWGAGQFWLLTRSDLQAPRHQNLAMFLIPSNLPGITIQRLGLFASGSTGEIRGGSGDKFTVFLDDVRVHESYLIGGQTQGWQVTNATLEVEHGGGSDVRSIMRNTMGQMLLEQCKANPEVKRRLKNNPQLLSNLVNVYIGMQIERLLSTRNLWFALSGTRAFYAGPQLSLYSKEFANRYNADIAKILGPRVLTDDDEWQLENGVLEFGQRGSLITAPGGTPEALKIIISRALRIGRSE